jgi:UDP-N-acetylglucosamine--N-acetylmuramyl-(pentapeptide) pyrophosphoryl-undecaprenol N-acetylglucosamine transferase
MSTTRRSRRAGSQPRTHLRSVSTDNGGSSGTTLFVSSHGGHFEELRRLAHRFAMPDENQIWVTHRAPQTDHALAAEQHVFVPNVRQRDVAGVARGIPHAWRMLRSGNVDSVVSTGAGVALSFLPLAAALGIPAHYVESATRVSDVAMVGRLLERIPGVTCHTQNSLDRPGWYKVGSVFDGYQALMTSPRPVRRAVVIVGSQYPFDRMVRRITEILPPDVEVLWQTGRTDVTGLAIDARPMVSHRELRDAIDSADVVISHAGVGAALDALDSGVVPVMIPREAKLGEHIDDHQQDLAVVLRERQLAIVATPRSLTWDDVQEAAARRVQYERPSRFSLAAA